MTMFLDSPEAAELAREKSVRGAVVKMALQRAAAADNDQRHLLEAALKEVLLRFERQEETGA